MTKVIRNKYWSQHGEQDVSGFEGVSEFKYLGAVFTNKNEVSPDIESTILARNRCPGSAKADIL